MNALPMSVTQTAMPGLSGMPTDATQQFITFTLDAEEYGVDIMMVREIKGWTATTALPKAPPHVRGVINLRGVIVPILDLRARFGMGTTTPTPTHVVIIVHIDNRTSGLLVDAVSDIISIDQHDVRPVPEMGLAIEDQYLDGLVAVGERMVTLVSLGRLLAIGGGAATADGFTIS
jgi:purine-binding chemotaxis protein CheW